MSTSDILMDEERNDIDMRLMDYHLADKDNHEVIEEGKDRRYTFVSKGEEW